MTRISVLAGALGVFSYARLGLLLLYLLPQTRKIVHSVFPRQGFVQQLNYSLCAHAPGHQKLQRLLRGLS
jgi:hypothetical protein